MNKHCIFVKDNQEQCGGFAIEKSQYCLSHDPDSEKARLERAKKGGAGESYQRLDMKLKPLEIKNAQGIVDASIQLINEVREGALPPKIATTIGYLLSITQKAYEKSNLEYKIETLERILLERGRRTKNNENSN